MRRALDSFLVCLTAAIAYLALGQRTFYGVDGWMLVRRVGAGDVRSDMHLIFKPMALAATELGGLLGMSVYESMVALSALGTAAGVGLIHAAARVLGAARREAFLVAAVAGTFPGTVFFATVLERHGPFFAFVGGAALATAWLARSPSARTALAFAVACTLAYAAHSTGILMVAGFLPLAVVWARAGLGSTGSNPWRPVLRSAAVAGLASVAGMVVARRLGVWSGIVENEGNNLAFFLQHASAHVGRPELLPRCAWNEVVTAFAPMSVLWLVAFRDPAPRLVAWATSVAVVGYLSFSFLILGDFDERGAYALPLAWPFAWVAVRRLPRALTWTALVIAAVLAFVEVSAHDDRHLDPWAVGMREIAGEREPFLLAAAWQDFELVFLHQPDAVPGKDFYDAFDAHGFDAAVLRDNADVLVAYLNGQRSRGRELLLTDPGLDMLREPADPGRAGPLVVDVLEQAFVFEPVARAGFLGFRLLPKE